MAEDVEEDSSPNEELIHNLEILLEYYKRQRDTWRTRAYAGAINAIQSFPKKITPENIRKIKIPGVGDRTVRKIIDYFKTGYFPEVQEAKEELEEMEEKESEEEKVLELFTKVWGIGKVKAKDLYEDGYRTIEELQKLALRHPDRFTSTQKLGLKYYQDLQQRIPRKFITQFKKHLIPLLQEKFGEELTVEIAGSYRRKKTTSGDVDCLITYPPELKIDLDDIVDFLIEEGTIIEKLVSKTEKFSGIAQGWWKPEGKEEKELFHPFHFDIELVPSDEWASALLYFTGSQATNIRMRTKAKNMGYKLNQKGIFKIRKGKEVLIPTETDEEIFQILDMEYIPPEKR